jgi:aminoglycoside phosphotransferase (APT) family kinase protein
MSLDRLAACLPSELQGATITRIAAGLSGAGVYRVEGAGGAYVLKVSDAAEPADAWRRRLDIQRRAAEAGVTPRVVHADEARRAVLTAFVADRSFAMLYRDPRTHEAALALLGRTLRRVHDLPLPPDAAPQDPRAFLGTIWAGLSAGGVAVPAFAREAIQRMLAEEPPADDRAPVLGHNDVNPTNLVYDGEALLLLDWQTAGPAHPFFDLAAISVFLRMTEATCQKLLAAHDDAPATAHDAPAAALPARFSYSRRLAAIACGTIFLHLARQLGHPGATGAETPDATPSLGDLYARLQTGSLSVASADGQWAFGLALLKESLSL